MNPDDDFVEHLRRVARRTPPLRVDAEQVLRAGRRRRRTRAAGVSALATVAVVATVAGGSVLLPGPGRPWPAAPPAGAPASSEAEPSPHVVLDAAAVTVTTPLDAWVLSGQELAITQAALSHHVDTCMAARGRDGYAEAAREIVVPVVPADGYATFGLWDPEQAGEDAYAPRPEPFDVYAGEDSPGTGVDHAGDDEGATSRACYAEADRAGLLLDLADVDAAAPAPAGLDPVELTEDGKDVIRAWEECLADRGVEDPDPEEAGGFPLVPDAVEGAGPVDRARISAVDLACKDELGTVAAVADIEAREQNAYVERAREHLTLRRDLEQEVLARAVAHLEAHGITVPAH